MNLDFYKLDLSKEWEAEAPPSKTIGIFLCIFGLLFCSMSVLAFCSFKKDFTPLIGGFVFLIGGTVFGVFGIKDLVCQVKTIKKNRRIVQEGLCTYAYISSCRETTVERRSQKSGDRYLTKIEAQYEYTNDLGEKSRGKFTATYNTGAPLFQQGRRIVIAFLGDESLVLRTYHFIEEDAEKQEEADKHPQTKYSYSFKGLSKETFLMDTPKWWITSTMSKLYFWISLVIFGIGVLFIIVGIVVIFTNDDSFRFVMASILMIPWNAFGLFFLLLALIGRIREKRFFKIAKFTHAKVFPMRNTYVGDEKTFVTYLYIDDKGQKHEQKLFKKYFVKTINRLLMETVAYTDDGKSMLIMTSKWWKN